MRKSILILASLVALTRPGLAQVMDPSTYVLTAGASDLYEIQSAQLVLQTTKDLKIRSFAQTMIAQHGESTAKVKAAAAQAGLSPPPPALTDSQNELLLELQVLSGPARDAAYIAQQKAAHGQALSVQKAYAADGTAAPLKAAAGDIVPVVEQHIAMLKTM